MKRIKAISMILAFVMIFMSCNFSMMFTSNAVGSVSDWNSLASGTTEITITKDIDFNGAVIEPFDAGGADITVDGGGHILSDFSVVGGALFVNVGSGSEFKNLGIYGAYIADFSATASSYGILCDSLTDGTVSNCFAEGTIAVYGPAEGVGGLIGSFDGTMTNCFTIADVRSNSKYLGGLIGRYTGTTANSEAITKCYSTGSINNASMSYGGAPAYNYVGGLIGYSPVSCVSNSYTTTFIHNAYADTVKAIGCIKGLAGDVYFDETISIQRQVDLDINHRLHPADFAQKLTNGWTNTAGYYPQLTEMISTFADVSAISAARVDLAQHETRPGLNLFNGTGREFTVISSTEEYNYAMLTNAPGIKWRISSGVDEYYFDPVNPGNLPTSNGSMPNGLSGNVMDTHSGKYLFTRSGDTVFTVSAGNYERDIAVHVTTVENSPYIIGGDGTSENPFLVSSSKELDFVRLYCINALAASEYSYKIDSAITLSGNWNPIVGMKGKFDGNSTTLTGLNIVGTNETHEGKQAAGLFANVSESAEILNLTIKTGKITINGSSNVDYAGILVGDAKNTNITGISLNSGPTITITTTDSASVGSVGSLAGSIVNGSDFNYSVSTVTLANPTVTVTSSGSVGNVGGVIGDANRSAVSGLTSSGTTGHEVTVTAAEAIDSVGGVIGSADTSSITTSASVTTNTVSTVKVTVKSTGGDIGQVGGAIGNAVSSGITGINLGSSATISVEGSNNVDTVGVLIGTANNSAVTTATIAKPKATVIATNGDVNYVGGVIGKATNSGMSSLTLSTSDTIAVTAGGSVASVGGVAGLADNSSISTAITLTAPDITVTAASNIGSVGGAVGKATDSDIKTVNLNTSATITVKKAGGAIGSLGGIAGSLTNSPIESSTVTAGKITVSESASVDYIGGVVGKATDSDITSANPVTSSAITVTTKGKVNYAGSLVGYAKDSAIDEIDITTGSITVTSTLTGDENPVVYVGGLVGYAEGENITNVNVTDSTITALADYGAGLVGYAKNIGQISSVHVANAQLLKKANNAGVAAGCAENVNFYQILASGSVIDSNYAGIIAGVAKGTTIAEQCTAMGKTTSVHSGGGIFGDTDSNVSVKDCYSTSVVMGASVCGGIIGTGEGTVETSVFTGMLYPKAGGVKAGITGGSDNVINSYFDKQSTGILFNQDHGATTAQLTDTTDPLNLNGDGETVWMWHTLNYSLFYPQLSVFNNSENDAIKYASGLSAVAITYSYLNDTNAGSSVCFDSAVIPRRYFDNNEIDISKVTDADVPVKGAYSQGSESNNKLPYSVKTKGPAVYKMVDTEKFKDIRYVLFNVNTLTANYRFEYAGDKADDMDSYNYDMGQGLSYFNTELGTTYGFILETHDSYDDGGTVTISPSSDMISIDLIQPFLYSGYEIELYTDKDETNKLIPVTYNSEKWYNISSLQTVYIKVIINTEELDWGIYNIDCN